jgi:hypothetical protein
MSRQNVQRLRCAPQGLDFRAGELRLLADDLVQRSGTCWTPWAAGRNSLPALMVGGGTSRPMTSTAISSGSTTGSHRLTLFDRCSASQSDQPRSCLRFAPRAQRSRSLVSSASTILPGTDATRAGPTIPATAATTSRIRAGSILRSLATPSFIRFENDGAWTPTSAQWERA